MLFTVLAPFVALAVGSSASALKPRAVSNNNCGRAVAGTAKGAAFQSTARNDCSSNLATTTTIVVTPLASTYISTVPVVETAYSTQTTTLIESTTTVLPATSTETDVYLTTAYSTSTQVDLSTTYETVLVPETLVVTVTASSTATITSYYPTAPVVKRGLSNQLNVAASGTIPAYASACTDFAEYSAACSLIGVTRATATVMTTLPASTITAITSSTSTTTLVGTLSEQSEVYFTSYQTTVVSSTVTSTITQAAVATSEALTTEYQTVVTTLTQTVTVPAVTADSTVTVALPVPTFALKMAPANGVGTTYYVNIVGSSLGYTGTLDPAAATHFTIDTANRLITAAAAPVVACAYSSLANYYMEALPYAYLTTHASTFTALNCKVNGDSTLVCAYNSANRFSYVQSQNSFFYTVPNYNGYPEYIAHLVPQ